MESNVDLMAALEAVRKELAAEKETAAKALAAEKEAAAKAQEAAAKALAAEKEAAAKARSELAELQLQVAVTRNFASLADVKEQYDGKELLSPNKAGPVPKVFHLSWGPPVTDGMPPIGGIERNINPTAALKEQANYPIATSYVPEWINAVERSEQAGGSMAAHTLFLGCKKEDVPTRTPVVSGSKLNWSCKPELFTVPKEPYLPAFNGELKSAMSSGESDLRLYVELATYCTLGTLASLFRDVMVHHERLFTEPPVSYGLAATGSTGYLVAFEWIGKQHMSIVSQPFFLGSPQHKAAVEALPRIDFAAYVVDMDLTLVPVNVWGPADPADAARAATAAVTWTTAPARAAPDGAERFLKILSSTFWSFEQFAQLRRVYTAYAKARHDLDDPPPESLCDARLLYGAGYVCVDMPFMKGHNAGAADLCDDDGRAVVPVSRAIAWLARHGLLYIDLRVDNVRIALSGSVTLVDYDDLVVLEHGITSFKDFCAALRASSHVQNDPQADYVGEDRALTPLGRALQAAWLDAPVR